MPVQIISGLTFGLTLGRGGSKGLPGKNVRPLGGQPLIAWSVAAGAVASTVARVLCSTDDDAIAFAATAAGAEVPFRRPSELATSAATDIDVFTHMIEWLAQHEGQLPEFFVQLRPTTPFRHVAWIDEAVTRMRADPTITCVRSITPAPHTPYKMWRTDESRLLSPLLTLPGVDEPYNMPRQALPKIYWHTGQLDVIRTETLMSGSMTGRKIEGIVVPESSAVDIDRLVDFQLAELCFFDEMPQVLIEYLAKRNHALS
jgi:N-acylneuraminate cytidylyltransferase